MHGNMRERGGATNAYVRLSCAVRIQPRRSLGSIYLLTSRQFRGSGGTKLLLDAERYAARRERTALNYLPEQARDASDVVIPPCLISARRRSNPLCQIG